MRDLLLNPYVKSSNSVFLFQPQPLYEGLCSLKACAHFRNLLRGLVHQNVDVHVEDPDISKIQINDVDAADIEISWCLCEEFSEPVFVTHL